MKIDQVAVNARKRAFQVTAGGREFPFPFPKLRLQPTADDPVVEALPDPEVGREAFTYRLRSGAQDTVHLDAVLEVNRDPDHLQALFFHRLTVEAVEGLRESGLGVRQVARLLGTSPSQLYRLLDPSNSSKSLGQMLALLRIVGREVEVRVGEVGKRAMFPG